MTMLNVRGTAKALVAGLIAALSCLLPLVDDGLTASEILGAALAGLVGWQAIYWIPNAEPQES